MPRSTVIVERDEDGVREAQVPSLNGCHTFANTQDQLQTRLCEVIQLCLEDESTEAASE